MNFTIYKTDTGEIVQSGTCSAADYDLQHIPDGCSIIELEADPVNQYVSNLVAIDKPAKPNDFCVFDYVTKQWVDELDLAKNFVGRNRAVLLQQSDWTQIPDVPLATKTQWASYRQALRDITTQEGYPFNVVWPTPPA